jgi:protein ImuA
MVLAPFSSCSIGTIGTYEEQMAMPQSAALTAARNRAAVMEELRRLLPGMAEAGKSLPLGLAALDRHLPRGGLPLGALHEVVLEPGETAAAFGFMAALLGQMLFARIPSTRPLFFITAAYDAREYGRPSGHGLNSFGLDPGRLILVETAHRNETLWAMDEALRSGAPAAVAGIIDRLDLRLSQKLHLIATDAGLPLLLLRPARTLESSAAATRWRVGPAKAARDRFGLFVRPRWHLHLERCRNGRPGEWIVEYDHVAHRFSLATALADPALSRGAGEDTARAARRA